METMNHSSDSTGTPETPAFTPRVSTDTAFLMQTIEANAKGNFSDSYSRTLASPTAKDREFEADMIFGEYADLMARISLYHEQVNPASDTMRDIEFLENAINRLFQAFHSKGRTLASAFADTAEQERFGVLMRKYLLENSLDTLRAAVQAHPNKSPRVEQSEGEASAYTEQVQADYSRVMYSVGDLEQTPKLPRRRISQDSQYLMATIEWNNRQNFLPTSVSPDSPMSEQEEWLRGEFEAFKFKIESYREEVDSDSDVMRDIDFLEGKVQKLFEAYYRRQPLVSAFADTTEKERFYKTVGQYLLEGYHESLANARKLHPKQFLTKAERDALSSPTIPE